MLPDGGDISFVASGCTLVEEAVVLNGNKRKT